MEDDDDLEAELERQLAALDPLSEQDAASPELDLDYFDSLRDLSLPRGAQPTSRIIF